MPLYPRTGNQGLASLLNQALAQPTDYRPWPGFRHPCRNDGFSGLAGLVYNGERSAWECLHGRSASDCLDIKNAVIAMNNTNPTFGFELLDPKDRRSQRRDALASRKLPPGLGNHKLAACHYQPDEDLVDAINVALAVGAPLLLTGEPAWAKPKWVNI